MKILQTISMVTVAAVVLNVWLFRFGKATIYRGGDATNMTEEFAAYGLSETMVYLVGGLKILAALGFIICFFNQKNNHSCSRTDGRANDWCYCNAL